MARSASRVTARVMRAMPPAVASNERTRSEVSPPSHGSDIQGMDDDVVGGVVGRWDAGQVVGGGAPADDRVRMWPRGSRATSAVNSSSNQRACPASSRRRRGRGRAGERATRAGTSREGPATREPERTSSPGPSASQVTYSRLGGPPADAADRWIAVPRMRGSSSVRPLPERHGQPPPHEQGGQRAGRRPTPASRENSTSTTRSSAAQIATAERDQPGDRGAVAALEQRLLVLLAEQDPVLGGGGDEQRGGHRRRERGPRSRRRAGSR